MTAKKAAKKAAKVKVKVTVEAVKRLGEDGVIYAKGETFETTEKRAKALGDLVKPSSE